MSELSGKEFNLQIKNVKFYFSYLGLKECLFSFSQWCIWFIVKLICVERWKDILNYKQLSWDEVFIYIWGYSYMLNVTLRRAWCFEIVMNADDDWCLVWEPTLFELAIAFGKYFSYCWKWYTWEGKFHARNSISLKRFGDFA